jgi:hypothetical protein
MYLSTAEYAIWLAGSLLLLLLCGLVFLRKLHRRLPFFTFYTLLVTARTILLWWAYHQPSRASSAVFEVYWLSEAALVAARGAAIGELCWVTLRPYAGVGTLGRRLLGSVAAILVVFAGLAARQDTQWIHGIVLRGERGLEVATVAVLVVLLGVCRYYSVRIEPLVRSLALGFGLYSAVQVANHSALQQWFNSFFPFWNWIRMISYQMATVIWCLALRKPLPPSQPAPVLLEPRVYEQLATQVSFRLRELNARLLEMLK